jgi:hypothetical protein
VRNFKQVYNEVPLVCIKTLSVSFHNEGGKSDCLFLFAGVFLLINVLKCRMGCAILYL